MRQKQMAAAGMALWLVSGCASRPAAPSSVVAPPLPAVKPSVAASVPPSAPLPVLPDPAELKQELAIVSSPQVSRERSLSRPGHVQDLGGAWVRFGPTQVGRIQPVLHKTGRMDVPFQAQLVVTHAQEYSDICQTQAQAAHAPLLYTQERTTIYRYDYPANGTWAYKDEKDGPLIDKGRR